MAIAISIEAGELLENFLWKDPSEVEHVTQNKTAEIRDEIADIAIYLVELADILHINLVDAMEQKLVKNAVKYPVLQGEGVEQKVHGIAKTITLSPATDMIVYQASKEGFICDVVTNAIEQRVLDLFVSKTGNHVGKSETDAWRKSLRYMRDVLFDDEIPTDSGVTIEYHILNSAKRVDFILTGQNEEKIDHAILIELKQWSEVKLSEKDGIVQTGFYGEQPHPSYQAWSYAALLQGFSETVYEENIQLRPCAYLHNYIPDSVIKNAFYEEYLRRAPVFLEGDAEKEQLRIFIKQFLKHGDKTKIMFRIDSGKIRPSKSLADSLAKMLKGNPEFLMIDDQKIVYEAGLALCKKSSPESKNVLIVEGGPGTGKSVVAINLLVALTKLGLTVQYVTKNSAPRSVYENKLTGTFRKTEITNFFSGSGAYVSTQPNLFDALVVDEAHRLNAKSGMFKNKGENQIKEIISSSKCSVFFIDEDQKVTWHDIGEAGQIKHWAETLKAKVHQLKLSSQFRCSGSDGYIAWLDDVLQIRGTANTSLNGSSFDFRVFDSPNQLRDIVFEKNKERNRARLVAGYCWDWISKTNKALLDIKFPEHSFAMRWNLESDGSLWVLAPESVNEIGCIHTCQGLEVDYVGVIIGPDLIVRDGRVITDPTARSRMDSSIKGYKAAKAKDPVAADKKADAIIKNTYRTLMSRGMKGCYVFCTDEETRRYFHHRTTTVST